MLVFKDTGMPLGANALQELQARRRGFSCFCLYLNLQIYLILRKLHKKRSPFHNADLLNKNKLLLTNYYYYITFILSSYDESLFLLVCDAKVRSFSLSTISIYIILFFNCNMHHFYIIKSAIFAYFETTTSLKSTLFSHF